MPILSVSLSVVWLVALVVFAAAEAATIGLTSIWFAAGSLAALIVSLVGGPLWLQVVFFLVVSLALLLAVRPLAKKYFIPRRQATNADRILGQEGVVVQPIDNLNAQGQVSVGGQIWTARAEPEALIPQGTTVKILRIEGVKVFVSPAAPSNT